MEELKNIIKELNVELHNSRNIIAQLQKQTRELDRKLEIANQGRDTLSRILSEEREFSAKCAKELEKLLTLIK